MELTKDTIQTYLHKEPKSPCLSIFMPTHPKTTSQRLSEDRIRLKNLLKTLEEQSVVADGMLPAYKKLTRLIDNNTFWLHQSFGLGVFASGSHLDTIKLPYELSSVAHIGDNYALSPLLIMQNMGHAYYLIDVNFKEPRLYYGDENGLVEQSGVKLPGSIEEVLDIEQRQRTVESRSGPSDRGSVFYGYAEVDESQSRDATRYLRLLVKPIKNFLNGKSTPLFIVGSPKVVVEFQDLLKYDHVLPNQLTANYDQHRVNELHTTASEAIAKIVHKNRKQAVRRFRDTDPTLRADGLTAVQTAAAQGKVETLLLPVLRVTEDGVNSDNQRAPLIELPEDFAPFDEAVRQVAKQSGVIVPVEQSSFASDPSMKAILRF